MSNKKTFVESVDELNAATREIFAVYLASVKPVMGAIKAAFAFSAQVGFVIMARPLAEKRIARERYIIEIMCLTHTSEVTGRMYTYGQVDQVLTENDIDFPALHQALAIGSSTELTKRFFAALDQQEPGD